MHRWRGKGKVAVGGSSLTWSNQRIPVVIMQLIKLRKQGFELIFRKLKVSILSSDLSFKSRIEGCGGRLPPPSIRRTNNVRLLRMLVLNGIEKPILN